jgi:hypothetical protein
VSWDEKIIKSLLSSWKKRLVAVWERAPDVQLRFDVTQRFPSRHGTAIVRKLRADQFGITTAGYDGKVVETDFRRKAEKAGGGGCTIS